ncbi:ribosomal protein S19 binding protein 1 [Gadus chalcogrammus]|uniref:ribosomal protein S19 binding protein 1 n=1 Tax=Gadus chalcogrammus TaxID=1042646 RepID=UPI0024C3767C|nr:ribosomal protein S19 binding protein 1 [Gadus chalcogrammus]
MSASIIRRGLDLLSNDIKDVGKGKSSKVKKRQTPSKANVMNMVSTNRRGVTKQVKRLQGRLGLGKSKTTVKDKRIKNAVEEFRKTQGKSHLTDNLAYFLGSGYIATDAVTKKIMNHHTGRQARNRPDAPVRKASETTSVFSEEEFQKFQKEYFGRTVE